MPEQVANGARSWDWMSTGCDWFGRALKTGVEALAERHDGPVDIRVGRISPTTL